jgi:hypothetical protein
MSGRFPALSVDNALARSQRPDRMMSALKRAFSSPAAKTRSAGYRNSGDESACIRTPFLLPRLMVSAEILLQCQWISCCAADAFAALLLAAAAVLQLGAMQPLLVFLAFRLSTNADLRWSRCVCQPGGDAAISASEIRTERPRRCRASAPESMSRRTVRGDTFKSSAVSSMVRSLVTGRTRIVEVISTALFEAGRCGRLFLPSHLPFVYFWRGQRRSDRWSDDVIRDVHPDCLRDHR